MNSHSNPPKNPPKLSTIMINIFSLSIWKNLTKNSTLKTLTYYPIFYKTKRHKNNKKTKKKELSLKSWTKRDKKSSKPNKINSLKINMLMVLVPTTIMSSKTYKIKSSNFSYSTQKMFQSVSVLNCRKRSLMNNLMRMGIYLTRCQTLRRLTG